MAAEHLPPIAPAGTHFGGASPRLPATTSATPRWKQLHYAAKLPAVTPRSLSARETQWVHPDIEVKRSTNQALLRERKERAQAIVRDRENEKIRRKARGQQAKRAAAQRQNTAASTLQAARRGTVARREMEVVRQERAANAQIVAVAKMQAMWRGVKGRKESQARAEVTLEQLKVHSRAVIEHNMWWLEKNLQMRNAELQREASARTAAILADEHIGRALQEAMASGDTDVVETAGAIILQRGSRRHTQWQVAKSAAREHAGDAASAPADAVATSQAEDTDELQPFWRSGRGGKKPSGSAAGPRMARRTSCGAETPAPLTKPVMHVKQTAPIIDGTAAKTLAGMRTVLARNGPRIIDMFRALDRDGDGTVSRAEFEALLPLLKLDSSSHMAMDELFTEIDTDGSGQIDYEELYKQLRLGIDVELVAELQAGAVGEIEVSSKNAISLRKGTRDHAEVGTRVASTDELRSALLEGCARVVDMFRTFDRNGDGSISKREFRAALPFLGFDNRDTAAIDAIFDEMDVDRSGGVEYSEMSSMMRRRLNSAPR